MREYPESFLESFYYPVGYNPDTGEMEETKPMTLYPGDPLAEKLHDSWKKNVRTIDKFLRDGRLDGEKFNNPLHEVRFYLDEED